MRLLFRSTDAFLDTISKKGMKSEAFKEFGTKFYLTQNDSKRGVYNLFSDHPNIS
jgi:hypothetical protein